MIATFFRQLEPNDMPVGGTAIAKALKAARDVLRRDPKSKDHKKVIVLITDGEDLEGSPVSEAKSLANDKVTIHVVQIGGRTPEPIPDVDDKGDVKGWRTSEDGRPMTTELTARAERQLKAVAEATDGKYIHAEKGTTGIDVIADELQHQMKTELSERYEDIYADVFMWPLMLAVALLLAEALLTDAPRRRFLRKIAPLQGMSASLRIALGKGGLAAAGPLTPGLPIAPPQAPPQAPPPSTPPPAPTTPPKESPAYVKEGAPPGA